MVRKHRWVTSQSSSCTDLSASRVAHATSVTGDVERVRHSPHEKTEGSKMGKNNRKGTGDPRKPGRPPFIAVCAVITAVGTTYATTHSLTVATVAGCIGLGCAALFK